MLIKEDLDILSKLFDDKLKGINTKLEKIEERFDRLEARIDKIEERFDRLEARIDKIEERFDRLEARIDKIEARVEALEIKFEQVDARLSKIEYIQENEILPRIQNIEECYLSTFERYKESCDKLENIEADVEVIKKIVYEHSNKLEMIS